MNAEIICVGTELLLGDIVNTNAPWLAQQLKELGINLYYISSVGDNKGRMKEVFKNAYGRSNLIIITGGLGPTEDDLTREVIGEVTGRRLIFYSNMAKEIKERFDRLKRQMSPNNLKQAYLPEGADIIRNRVGTAPGIYLKMEKCIFVALPGVPQEMKTLFTEEVLPKLRKELPDSKKIYTKVLHMCGIGESNMEDKIKDLIRNQTSPMIAPYAGKGEVYLKITAKALDETEAENIMAGTINEIYHRLGSYIYGEDDDTLEIVVGRLLKDKKLKIALAESCTGGLISHRITNVPGSSAYFERGFVTYSNEAKMEELGVLEETLKKYGAVSKETAKEMVLGALKNSDANIGMAITGIAGPTGGTAQKPVGLVYCAIGDSDNNIIVHELRFSGEREKIKYYTSQYALYYLWHFLKNDRADLRN